MASFGKILALIIILLLACQGLAVIIPTPVGSAQSVDLPPNFILSIVASINGYSSACTFGINQDAPIGYSSKFDSPASPSYPSSGVYSWLFNYNSSYEKGEQMLSRYVIPSNGSASWHLKIINIDQTGYMTLTWSDTSFASMTLRDGVLRNVLADMNKVSNFTFYVDAWGVMSEFDIVYNWSMLTKPIPTPFSTRLPTTTPTIPEFPALVIILPLFTLMLFGLLVHRKRVSQGQ